MEIINATNAPTAQETMGFMTTNAKLLSKIPRSTLEVTRRVKTYIKELTSPLYIAPNPKESLADPLFPEKRRQRGRSFQCAPR